MKIKEVDTVLIVGLSLICVFITFWIALYNNSVYNQQEMYCKSSEEACVLYLKYTAGKYGIDDLD